MSAGYGRGYYGDDQLTPKAPKRGGWWKLALVAGAGAAIWFLWPRKPKIDLVGYGDQPLPPSPQPVLLQQPVLLTQQPSSMIQQPMIQQSQVQQPQAYPSQQVHHSPQVYASQQAYEDAVVEGARQLQATGAKVVLAPHLQHLASRLEP